MEKKYIKIGNNIVDAVGIKSIKFDLLYIGDEKDTIIRCLIERYENRGVEQYNIYSNDLLEELCSEIQRTFGVYTSAKLILAELESLKFADTVIRGESKQEKVQQSLS